MLGLFLLYKIRSAGTQLNIITLGNMRGRGPRENIPEKVYICEFLKDFNLCVVSARLLRNVCTFLYLVYNSQAGIGINFINLL